MFKTKKYNIQHKDVSIKCEPMARTYILITPEQYTGNQKHKTLKFKHDIFCITTYFFERNGQ